MIFPIIRIKIDILLCKFSFETFQGNIEDILSRQTVPPTSILRMNILRSHSLWFG